ncbi:N-6 DNA methylase [Niabella sp.]|uniref:N-6 DNA methylase n=1 Tax=Niabella sp. TaxID=1962976 RepID=UPI00260290DB|nr:N-6 DNA methylase [Niabella sp.]
MSLRTAYNERSWAIDLIGVLKSLSTQNNRAIKDAGGEQTIRTDGGSLFPDVLLFGDRTTARILQGWELKMPDTDINDVDFRTNAEMKARALGLDSFILWNVAYVQLYILDPGSNDFVRSKTWSDLADITTRQGILSNRARWEALAKEVFKYLNDLFEGGTLEGRQFIEAYRSGGVTALIMENAGQIAEALKDAARRDAVLRANMILWWDRYRAEYAGSLMEHVLAQVVISNWIGKILFAHILREKDHRAQQVAAISEETTPAEAIELFEKLSEDCNFWTIFSNSLGLEQITDRAWDQLKQFNKLLADLRVGSVDQTQLSNILEATVEVATRKLRGQYPTPIELARLLAHICVRNVVNDRIYDPCCGSGTIARAALEQKLAAGVSPDLASKTVFASDQDPQAIQIATFALARPDLMHIPLRIFKKDAFDLDPTLDIEFRNPSDGTLFSEKLGAFQAITSNLPFVAQAGRKQYGNALQKVVATMGMGKSFTGRADVAAYLPFALHPLLSEGGRLGIVITNAWLGTDWGDDFYKQLNRYYDLKCVITSGAGRWFKNSDVVTNILILDKKIDTDIENREVKYVVLTRPLEEMSDEDSVQIAAAQIEIGQTQNETMMIRAVNISDLERFRNLGLGGNAQFVNCDWILNLPLAPLKNTFFIKRGERRGKNDLFYPKPGHNIEPEYIKPLAKGPSHFKRLSAKATKEAFSCPKTEEELADLGHNGALNWIKRFKTDEVVSKLTKPGKLWYQMDADDLAELVMFINYNDRLFVGKVDPPAFADQRLVPLIPKTSVDIDLYHAILNCTISMFIIEGMGFGRGLGALDLNKDRIENYMHVLDVSKLDDNSIQKIKEAFLPLTKRDILPVADELEQPDRQTLDDTVIEAFGLTVDRQQIYDALLALVEIRRTALD